MGAMASQITSLTIVYSTFYSDADQSKLQSSASLAFVWRIHRWPVNSPHKRPVTRAMFPFDDVIMSDIVRNLDHNADGCQIWIACLFVMPTKHRQKHLLWTHDDVITWKHFPCYWPFVRGIRRSPVNSPHKAQWRGALMFSLICILNKRLSKQSWGWWFETPSCSLSCHCNAMNKCFWDAVEYLSEKMSYTWGTEPTTAGSEPNQYHFN